MRASARAAMIARLTLTKKAYDVAVLDLRGLTTMADFFVVCSADSENQIKAIADAVEEGMEERSESPWHKEAGSPNWVLLDYVDVVLHIFHKDARSFYSLEKLWGDSVITAVTDENPEPDLEKRARGRSGETVEAPVATVVKPRAGTKSKAQSAKKPGSARRSRLPRGKSSGPGGKPARTGSKR